MGLTVADVLARYGARLDESQLAEALDALLRDHFAPVDGGAGLNPRDRDLLQRAGLRFDDPRAVDAAFGDTAAGVARLVSTAATVANVAKAMGVDPSRVRHRIAAGALCTVPAGRGRARLVPRFQLDEHGRPLPGLASVLAALPEGLHPLEVEGFFTTAQPDLDLDGHPLTPRDWLATGGEMARVAELARGLAHLLR